LYTEYLIEITQYWPIVIILGFIGFKYYRTRVSRAEMNSLGDFQNVQLVDVRSEAEYSKYALPLSINIPLQVINSESKQLDKAAPVILFCASGTRSAGAKQILKRQGFSKVINAGTIGNVQSYLNSRD